MIEDLNLNQQKVYDRILGLVNNNVAIWHQKAIIDAVDELVDLLLADHIKDLVEIKEKLEGK